MEKMRFYIFCIRWLWENRTWAETRQKYKAMARDWRQHSGQEVPVRLRWSGLMYWEG